MLDSCDVKSTLSSGSIIGFEDLTNSLAAAPGLQVTSLTSTGSAVASTTLRAVSGMTSPYTIPGRTTILQYNSSDSGTTIHNVGVYTADTINIGLYGNNEIRFNYTSTSSADSISMLINEKAQYRGTATTNIKIGRFIFRNGSGSSTNASLECLSLYTTSDERKKENIKPYIYHDSICDIPIKEFDYKDTKTHSIGVIAQEVQKKFPELVDTDEDGYLSINPNEFTFLLMQEVKMLKERVKELEDKINGNSDR